MAAPKNKRKRTQIHEDTDPAAGATAGNKKKKKKEYTREEQLIEIAKEVPDYRAYIHPVYRPLMLRNPSMQSWSPLQLFLHLAMPILQLLQYHTNIMAQRDPSPIKPWKRLTIMEIRYWLAYRLRMVKERSPHARMASLWAYDKTTPPPLGRDRFEAIEHYICLESGPPPTSPNTP